MGVSLIDKLGVVEYLNATTDEHNGHDGREFVELITKLNVPQDGFVKVTVEAAAKHYNVHRHTFADWITRYNKEHAKNHD